MPRTPAGEFRDRVTFQRTATTRGALGGKTPGVVSALGTRKAKVRWGSSAERRNAAVEQAVQATTFRLRLDSVTRQVLATDKLLHVETGLTFDLTGIAPFADVQEIEFTGMASRG